MKYIIIIHRKDYSSVVDNTLYQSKAEAEIQAQAYRLLDKNGEYTFTVHGVIEIEDIDDLPVSIA